MPASLLRKSGLARRTIRSSSAREKASSSANQTTAARPTDTTRPVRSLALPSSCAAPTATAAIAVAFATGTSERFSSGCDPAARIASPIRVETVSATPTPASSIGPVSRAARAKRRERFGDRRGEGEARLALRHERAHHRRAGARGQHHRQRADQDDVRGWQPLVAEYHGDEGLRGAGDQGEGQAGDDRGVGGDLRRALGPQLRVARQGGERDSPDGRGERDGEGEETLGHRVDSRRRTLLRPPRRCRRSRVPAADTTPCRTLILRPKPISGRTGSSSMRGRRAKGWIAQAAATPARAPAGTAPERLNAPSPPARRAGRSR